MDIISRQHAMQAAILRNASPEELTRMRQEMHDVLDAYLDHSAEAAVRVLALKP